MKRRWTLLLGAYAITGFLATFGLEVAFNGLPASLRAWAEEPLALCGIASIWPLALLRWTFADTPPVVRAVEWAGYLACFGLAYAVLARFVPRRFPAGYCSRCGYDLRATPERCPECGTVAAVAESDRRERATEAQRHRESHGDKS